MYEYPPILTGDALQQIAALRDYLVRRVRESDAETVPLSALRATSPGGGSLWAPPGGELLPKATEGGVHSESRIHHSELTQASAALRSLIVKTADLVEHYVEELRTELHEDYVAISDYGSYYETIESKVSQTARGTVESYQYQEQLDALDQYTAQLSGQIRRGLITDPETQETVLGIAISQDLRFTGRTVTEDGLEYWELSPGQTLGLYTSTGWQFWINGSKRGWFDSTDGMLHVSQILVEDRLQHGADWLVTTAGGYGIRYIGT